MAMIPEGRMLRIARDWGPLLTLIFLAGIAWSTMEHKVDQKLDSIRYVADSVRRDAFIARQDRDLEVQQLQLTSAINRLSQLICYQSPNPACR